MDTLISTVENSQDGSSTKIIEKNVKSDLVGLNLNMLTDSSNDCHSDSKKNIDSCERSDIESKKYSTNNKDSIQVTTELNEDICEQKSVKIQEISDKVVILEQLSDTSGVTTSDSTKQLSDVWVAELLSVDSDNSQSNIESEKVPKEANITESNQKKEGTFGTDEKCKSPDIVECSQDSEVVQPHEDIIESSEKFVVDKGAYRDESDSWTADESDSCSSSSDNAASDSSDSSLDFMKKGDKKATQKKAIPCIKTRGELGIEDLPPIEELCISVLEKESELIGKVHSIVEQLVVVRAIKGLAPIDLDSVLFLSHSRPLGRVFDVFGPVTEPFYSVRFNNEEEIKMKLIKIGMDVFYAPGRSDVTKFVFVDQLKKQKGSDASWSHNNEPPEEFLDYSNDEEERTAKKKRQMKKRYRENEEEEPEIVASETPGVIPTPVPSPMRYQRPTGLSNYTGQLYAVRQTFPNVIRTPVTFYSQRPPQIGGNFVIATRITNPYSPVQRQTPRFSYFNQVPEHRFGQISNPRLFSPAPVQNASFQNFNQACRSPALVPMTFARTPPPLSSQPTIFFSPTPNFVRAPLLSPVGPQFQQNMPNTLMCAPMPHVASNVPPPNVPLSIQVPPNYLSSPPPMTPTVPMFQPTPTVYFNPHLNSSFQFQNNHV